MEETRPAEITSITGKSQYKDVTMQIISLSCLPEVALPEMSDIVNRTKYEPTKANVIIVK